MCLGITINRYLRKVTCDACVYIHIQFIEAYVVLISSYYEIYEACAN